MRRILTILGFTAAVTAAAASFILVPAGATKAAVPEGTTFLIPASDGYGVADCLTGGSECGQVVANAWCEAHGFGRADKFGLAAAEDATGSVGASRASARAERPISITCGN